MDELGDIIALYGDLKGIDVFPIFKVLEQQRAAAATTAATASGAGAGNTASPANVVAGTTTASDTSSASAAATQPTTVPSPAPAANPESTIAESPDTYLTTDTFDEVHASLGMSDRPAEDVPDDNPSDPDIAATEAALRRIARAKRVGPKVKLYKHLEDIVMAWIFREASQVMPPEEFKKTDTVRGLLRRINAILDKRLRPIRIPKILVEIWAQVLEVRYEVADEYIQDQELYPDPELEAANERHQFYRKYLPYGLQRCNEYRNR